MSENAGRKTEHGTDEPRTGDGGSPRVGDHVTKPGGKTIATGKRPYRFIRRQPGRNANGQFAPRNGNPGAPIPAGGNANSGETETRTGIEPGPIETKTEIGAQEFNVVQAENLNQGAPKRKYSKRKSAMASATSDDSLLAASVLVGILDTAAQAAVGEAAAITLAERQMIEQPLGRIMERLSPEMTQRVQTLADPVLLMFGLGLWAMRLYKIKTVNTEIQSAQTVATAESNPKPETPPEPSEPGRAPNAALKPREAIFLTTPI